MARRRQGDSSERRTKSLSVQLTPAERAVIDARAAAYSHTVSDFARVVLLSDLKAPAPSRRDRLSLRAVAAEISRVGNNVNQLARMANIHRAVPQQEELRRVTATVIAALERVLSL